MGEFTVPALVTAPPVGGLADCVYDNATADPDHVLLNRKDSSGEWREVTAGQFRDEVLAVAKGLIAQGVRFGDRIALMSRTRYEWTLLDFAIWSVGAQSVPIYPTASAEQVAWILRDADVTAALVEHEDHAMTIGSVVDQVPRLRRLWQLDAGAEKELTDAGTRIDDDVVRRHRMAVTPDSTATLIYTSGTTGRPKGCVLTHGNFAAEVDNIIARYRDQLFRPYKEDPSSTLLFLPLAHVLGRMLQVVCVRGRVRMGHQPNVTAAALLPDLASFRPTFILGVPYIFERVYDTARRRAETEGRAAAFDRAAEVAVQYAEALEARSFGQGHGPSAALRMRHQVCDKLVYGKLRAALGGRCRYAVSGGSAMERRLGLFFAGVGVRVFEGYGLTETTAAATVNPPERPRYGTVGQPIPGVSVRIAEDGEVWLRGAIVFQGYLNSSRATKEALQDGWLATGDLGALDEDGYLTLTGRKKEVLVTSGGKTVSPAPLEHRVRTHPLVAQCLVIGNDRPYVSALVTLDEDAVAHWLTVHGKPELDPTELVRDTDLELEVRRAVVAANTTVSQAESIRTFRILAARFTEEDGLVTPSLKLKRKAIEEAYAQEIEALYHR
ncbi:AMP-dependent synthetase/ligase [Streptomyces sp. NPDC005438]|uniref:AMP-dependent synthetase/ligase n=1 Tax=Streptomyces sp. NPDC005438 TaxID=3156880 RepID=UPI0033A77014